jgi:hypothetical protein
VHLLRSVDYIKLISGQRVQNLSWKTNLSDGRESDECDTSISGLLYVEANACGTRFRGWFEELCTIACKLCLEQTKVIFSRLLERFVRYMSESYFQVRSGTLFF